MLAASIVPFSCSEAVVVLKSTRAKLSPAPTVDIRAESAARDDAPPTAELQHGGKISARGDKLSKPAAALARAPSLHQLRPKARRPFLKVLLGFTAALAFTLRSVSGA